MLKKLKIFSYVFLFVFLFAGCSYDKGEKPTDFIRINGDEVSKAEFGIYFEEAKLSFEEIGGSDIWETDFDGRSAIEVARESAFNSMVTVKVSAQKAKEFNITLDENMKKSAEGSAADLLGIYEEKGINISDNLKEAMQKVMEEKELYSMVRQYVVKDYTISESEFETYSDSYFEETAELMRKITIMSISCKDEETASIVYDKAVEGIDFENLSAEYGINGEGNHKARLYEIYQKDIEGELGQLLEAQEGYVTRPVQIYDGTWRIIKVISIKESSEEAVREKLRNDYTNTMWQQIFSKELDRWIQESHIEKNDEAWLNLT